MSEADQRRFLGRTAIVTGAGAGIGRATTKRLLADGARVVATDLLAERLADLAAEAATDQLVTVAGDISTEETVQAVVAAADGRVDILVNNAGIMDGYTALADIDDALWDRIFAVNVTSMMRTSRAVLPMMLAAGKGAIVNTASICGLRAGGAGASYTAAKHAVIGLTKSASYIYAPMGVRVNAIAPGAVKTSIVIPAKPPQFSAMDPIRPAAVEAEVLAGHICWLASDQAANITGAVLSSDGGWSAI